jgi:hypothetical protein
MSRTGQREGAARWRKKNFEFLADRTFLIFSNGSFHVTK